MGPPAPYCRLRRSSPCRSPRSMAQTSRSPATPPRSHTAATTASTTPSRRGCRGRACQRARTTATRRSRTGCPPPRTSSSPTTRSTSGLRQPSRCSMTTKGSSRCQMASTTSSCSGGRHRRCHGGTQRRARATSSMRATLGASQDCHSSVIVRPKGTSRLPDACKRFVSALAPALCIRVAAAAAGMAQLQLSVPAVTDIAHPRFTVNVCA